MNKPNIVMLKGIGIKTPLQDSRGGELNLKISRGIHKIGRVN